MATVSCPTPPVAPATSTFSVEVITPAPQVLTGIWNKYIVVGNRIGNRESGIGNRGITVLSGGALRDGLSQNWERCRKSGLARP
ncbi:hypothetical protein [Moorena sp. SIO2C4]|uniref:hypothetical protein n=1 Tax=Moorena sp. SIO2C4 TaxID=2607824 RepID=UPI0013C7AB2A|nr:hypothetical protein [Moorena sp. SIO2C4]NES42882.1 hypothetical protein [Moorena sp. SIO2C4]